MVQALMPIDFLLELRRTLRALRTRRGFTMAALATLSLAIGANTAVFSVIDAVLLRPPAFSDPGRLVVLTNSIPEVGVASFPLSPPELRHYDDRVESFSTLAAYTPKDFNLTGRDEPLRLVGAKVTGTFFATLGVEPILGRALVPQDEDAPGVPVVIGYDLWQRLFGGASDVLGAPLQLDGTARTIVGVAPRGFDLGKAELWVPRAFTPEVLGAEGLGRQYLRAVARLRPGASPAAALAALQTAADAFHREHAAFYEDGWTLQLTPLGRHLAGAYRTPLLVLWGAVALVLLIACTNISSLMLARGLEDHQEFAIRSALGAEAARLARNRFLEAGVLACAGGILGVVLARFGLDLVRGLAPAGVPGIENATVDLRVLLFALSAAGFATLVTAWLPALQAMRADLAAVLGSGRGGAGHSRAHQVLAISELALGLPLIVATALLSQSFLYLTRVDPGFETGGALTAHFTLSPAKYQDAAAAAGFQTELLAAVHALPGALAAGGVTALPLSGRDNRAAFTVEGEAAEQPAADTAVHTRLVTPGYFEALDVPLVAGRFNDERDGAAATPTAWINETMARLLWPDRDPLGQRLSVGGPWATVTGVVGDVRSKGLDSPIPMEVYFPYAQASFSGYTAMTLLMRTAGDPMALAPALRAAVAAVDPRQPISELRTFDAVIASSVAPRAFQLGLLGSFAALALALAALGVFSVISYGVGRRTREIGVRTALGASPRGVLAAVLGEGLRLTAVGLPIGLLAAAAMVRVLESSLFGIGTHDVSTFAGVSFFLTFVSLAACLAPAWKATRIDPLLALNHE